MQNDWRAFSNAAQQWDGRGRLFAAAAEAMRRILVENARQKANAKRGGNFRRVELPAVTETCGESAVDLLAVDEALQELERQDPEKARIVKLRFFAELTLEQTAEGGRHIARNC